ncbi:hypothetical protein C0580_04210 [Candidatus Parcubacteria bacterium]|nr:MAG: hypothetical protein C0580_04210 [Candidatus Parcubacteria bacterium]
MSRRITEVKGLSKTTLDKARRQIQQIEKRNPHKGQVLVPRKEDPHVKYERLLRQAQNTGRIDGPFRCCTCGSRYLIREDATGCCRPS